MKIKKITLIVYITNGKQNQTRHFLLLIKVKGKKEGLC